MDGYWLYWIWIGGGLLAALIVFSPSFLFVLVGAPHFDRVRANATVKSFLRGARPAVIVAIARSAIPLGRGLTHLWQNPILAGALLMLLVLRRSVVACLVLAGVVGLVVALAGAPV